MIEFRESKNPEENRTTKKILCSNKQQKLYLQCTWLFSAEKKEWGKFKIFLAFFLWKSVNNQKKSYSLPIHRKKKISKLFRVCTWIGNKLAMPIWLCALYNFFLFSSTRIYWHYHSYCLPLNPNKHSQNRFYFLALRTDVSTQFLYSCYIIFLCN